MTTQLRGIIKTTFSARLLYAIRDVVLARDIEDMEGPEHRSDPAALERRAAATHLWALAGLPDTGTKAGAWLEGCSDAAVRMYAAQAYGTYRNTRKGLAA